MDLLHIASSVAGSTWFHVTRKKLLNKVINDGLVKKHNKKWGYRTGDGIYVVKDMYGAINYLHVFDVPEKLMMICELNLTGTLLMDEDSVQGSDPSQPPREEFEEAYPDATIKMNTLIERGFDPNDSIIQIINEMKIPPDPNFMDGGQGGINSLTARYPGSISANSIINIYGIRDGEPYLLWSRGSGFAS